MPFLGKKKDMIVNHIDGNKANAEIQNLEYVTPSENVIHAIKNGLLKTEKFKHGRKVTQMDLKDNKIKSFNNIAEAVHETVAHRSGITRCCNGKQKLSGGYKWRYSNDHE